MALGASLLSGPRLSHLWALLAAATLTACGTVADDPLLGVARDVAQGVLNLGAEAQPAVDPRQVLTRDIIDRAGLPLILLEQANAAAGLTMVRAAVNGPNETWQGEGGTAVILSREGILRATHGAGADLYASNIAQTRAALVGGRSGTVSRLYVHVNGDLEHRQTTYRCDIARAGTEQVAIFSQARTLTRLTETCFRDPTGAEEFQNRYWVDNTGFAWVSEQWAGSDLGHFRIERLHP